MKLARLLTELIGIVLLVAVIGCSSATSVEVTATPHAEATIEVKVEKAPQSAAKPSTAALTTTSTALAESTTLPSPTLRPKAHGRKAVPVPTPTLRPMVRGQKDSSIEVTVYNRAKAWPGTTLLSDHHDIDNPRIIEVNMLGEVTWQYVLPEDLKQYTNPGQDVERLPNGNTLLVMPGKGIVEVNNEGEVVWSHMDERVSHDADRLINGNTLYAYGNNDGLEDAQAKEVTPDGELVWQW